MRTPLWIACLLLVALAALLLIEDARLPGTAEAQNASQAPVFDASETGQRVIPENTAAGVSVGGAVTAHDPEGGTVTYSLIRSRTGDATDVFSIDSSTGQISTSAPSTTRPSPSTSSPSTPATRGGRGRNLHMAIRLTDVDEAPTITRTSPTIADSPDATALRRSQTVTNPFVATFAAPDPEGGRVTWSLTGADAGDFTINSAGRLGFAVLPDINNPADSDGDHIYDVNVVATDASNNASTEHPVTVTVFGIQGPRVVTVDESSKFTRPCTGW